MASTNSENAALRARIAQLEALLVAHRIEVPPPPTKVVDTVVVAVESFGAASTAADHKQATNTDAAAALDAAASLPPPPVQAVRTHSLSNSQVTANVQLRGGAAIVYTCCVLWLDRAVFTPVVTAGSGCERATALGSV